MSLAPLCFVLMPFGRKKDPSGRPDIDFDKIYQEAIEPAIIASGMEPIRADNEQMGGIIHSAMFERLLLCDFAIADMTTNNPNVFYEMGIRHAIRPRTTIAIFANHQILPFDVAYLRSVPYDLGENNKFGEEESEKLKNSLIQILNKIRNSGDGEMPIDSPVFQLLKDFKPPEIAHLKTDTFRERANYSESIKKELATARRCNNIDKIKDIEGKLGAIIDVSNAGVAIDIFLSYRALSDWDNMIQLYSKMPMELQRTIMLREQLAFAYNRRAEKNKQENSSKNNDRYDALDILNSVIDENTASSETYGLIGRVYKDLWKENSESGKLEEAQGYLQKAIDAYLSGFEADWRDAYPGINAVTLLEIKGDKASLRKKSELLPIVKFAVNQKIKQNAPDYWDHATLLELAVLSKKKAEAEKHLSDALASVREAWEPKTTADNLELIYRSRLQTDSEQDWLSNVISKLKERSERN